MAEDEIGCGERERQIKNWRREKRVALIQAKNPNWIDLSLSITEALHLA